MVLANVMKDTGYGLYKTGTHNVFRGHHLAKIPLQEVLISAMLHLAAVTLYTMMKSAQNQCYNGKSQKKLFYLKK